MMFCFTKQKDTLIVAKKRVILLTLFFVFNFVFSLLLFSENTESLNDISVFLRHISEPFPLDNLAISKHEPDSKIQTDFFYLNNPWLGLKALHFGYDEISDIAFDNDVEDWRITVNSKFLYWADGCILPQDMLESKNDFTPFINYYYAKHLLDPSELTDEEIKMLHPDNLINTRIQQKPSSKYFFAEIYGEFTEQKLKKHLRAVKVFTSVAYMHERVIPPLEKALSILEEKKNRKALKPFLNNFRQAYGFNWRNIADSQQVSLHSWGIAIDLMAKNYYNLKTYWYWEALTKNNWMMFKPNQRWRPPQVVIDAFEEVGFIWGGYWVLWDTMHFEFRPELIYINQFFASMSKHKFREEAPNKVEKINSVDNENIQKDEG